MKVIICCCMIVSLSACTKDDTMPVNSAILNKTWNANTITFSPSGYTYKVGDTLNEVKIITKTCEVKFHDSSDFVQVKDVYSIPEFKIILKNTNDYDLVVNSFETEYRECLIDPIIENAGNESISGKISLSKDSIIFDQSYKDGLYSS